MTEPTRHRNPDDEALRTLFANTRTIAIVGASPRPSRPSHDVMRSLQAQGYRTLPINPAVVGQTILGERVYARLAEVEGRVDIVDIFRNSAAAGGIVDDAIAERERLGIRAVWTQMGVRDEDAAMRAATAGMLVVMDRCLKIDVARVARVPGPMIDHGPATSPP